MYKNLCEIIINFTKILYIMNLIGYNKSGKVYISIFQYDIVLAAKLLFNKF